MCCIMYSMKSQVLENSKKGIRELAGLEAENGDGACGG